MVRVVGGGVKFVDLLWRCVFWEVFLIVGFVGRLVGKFGVGIVRSFMLIWKIRLVLCFMVFV